MPDNVFVPNSENGAAALVSRIRAQCLKRGWSFGRLAERAGLSRTTLYHLLRGTTSRPHPTTLTKICRALDLPLFELIGDDSRRADRMLCATGNDVDTRDQRAFDCMTNPVIEEVFDESPEMFAAWSQQEWEELYSTFGTGGALTRRGVEHTARKMNRKRETIHQLHVVLETHLDEVAARMIAALYEMVRPQSNLAPSPDLAALMAEHPLRAASPEQQPSNANDMEPPTPAD